MTIALAVWIKYTNVTDTDGRTFRHRTTAKTPLKHSATR